MDVFSNDDYINLYHVFERLKVCEKRFAKHTLVRRQIGVSRWALFVVPPGKRAPNVGLADDYDPVRGRYKRYAEQLAAGELLTFSNRAEAVKARRAWQLYLPRANRQNLRPMLRKLQSEDFVLLIVDRTKSSGGHAVILR